ncbi:hypothetical protein Sjap_009057 [Stephania japonica]|uniref:Uncharacterized protein n=1 Tax=Stephania japonica TaxID=461633 RepID=A0AAP0JQP6_9MAGN
MYVETPPSPVSLKALLQNLHNTAYASVKDLFRGLEQLFVDMIQELLSKMANMVLKKTAENSLEDLEQNAKEALKLISKFEELKGLDPWSFQVGTTTKTNSATNANVSTATEANIQGIPVTQNRMSSMFFEGASSNTSDGKLRFVEDRGCGSRHVISVEVIQVDLGFPN